MNELGFIKIGIFIVIILLIAKPLGIYIKRVISCEKTWLDYVLVPVEKLIYSICRVDPESEHTWKEYCINLLIFNFIGILLLYVIQIFQYHLPFNPQKLGNLSPLLAINNAISFGTNTCWQAYTGESTMGYFVQMVGFTTQNFISAATGLCVAVAIIRAFTRKNCETIGNFWQDLVRCVLWILLPLAVIVSLFYVWQGVPQNLGAYVVAKTLEGIQQVIPQGPVATFESIKLIGTNGGGFFGVNSMHPYENPTALTNLIQMISIVGIGSALVYTFGLMVGSKKQGWAILISMLILFAGTTLAMYYFEGKGNPKISELCTNSNNVSVRNMEGKEARFGVDDSLLYMSTTTSVSCGANDSSFDTMNPMSAGMAILNMGLGEIIIGGVGSGLYMMIMFMIMTVFMAGLMVGRTPELLGKKIGATEMKFVMLALLISPFCALFFTALGCFLPSVINDLIPYGPHGFTRLLYAFSSTANNNGSSFVGLNANTTFFNISTAICMALGRYVSIVAVLGIAGSLARKKSIPSTVGTLKTNGALFVIMLIICILIIGGLTYFPALTLGPIIEHFMLFS